MTFADHNRGLPEEDALSPAPLPESPHHGFRGDRAPSPPRQGVPSALTIALSREAGSRGHTISQRVGQKLGWPVYNQELLECLAHEGPLRQNVADNLAGDAQRWADDQLQKLLREEKISQHPSVLELARVILALGTQGEVVLVGRGAGLLLPRESTLHVRIIAPLADRVAYLSQWLRLTEDEAAEQVRLRDSRRADFLATHFHQELYEIHQYDLILNSSLLGEELCAELIARAARAKLAVGSEQ